MLAALVATAVLSGCSEKQEASDTLPTTAAETTESLPLVGPADFPVPDEARTKDAAGAEAFLQYWIDLLNRQRSVPDGRSLRDLGPECQNCQRIAQNYDEAAAAGIQYDGGAITIDDMAQPTLVGDEVTISFLASQSAVRRLDASGVPVDSGQPAATKLSSGITMRWSGEDQTWLIQGFDLG